VQISELLCFKDVKKTNKFKSLRSKATWNYPQTFHKAHTFFENYISVSPSNGRRTVHR